MGTAVVLGVLLLFLTVMLAGLLSSLDWDGIRATPSGSLSGRGVRAVVGGGFLVGLAYGIFIGIQGDAETWRWLSRGVVDGLVVACAGAFYVGFQQRRSRPPTGAPREPSESVEEPTPEGSDLDGGLGTEVGDDPGAR